MPMKEIINKIIWITQICIFLLISSLPTYAEFKFEKLVSEVTTYDNWITIRISFTMDSEQQTSDVDAFSIGFDGNLRKDKLHAIRLDKKTFYIPDSLSHKNQFGRFFISRSSIKNGSFRKLYNFISEEERIRLGEACAWLNNDKRISKILNDLAQRFPIHRSFLEKWGIKGDALNLAQLCDEHANRVYVKDLQKALVLLGYDIGAIDGKWGKKTKAALKVASEENNFELNEKPSIDNLRKLREALGNEAPKLSDVKVKDQHFDIYGKIELPPVPKTVATNSPVKVSTKLKKRKTINVFRAWNSSLGLSKYGLAWTAYPKYSSRTITLNEVYWNYHYIGKSWSYYKGIEKFLTKKNWDHDAEYGKTVAVKIVDPNYAEFIAKTIKKNVKSSKSDGVMLDWWHDHHQSSSGYNKFSVNAARQKIAKNIRKELGPDKIILGNVNWRKDVSTVKNLNGVFLELYKEPYKSSSGRLYTFSELLKIESLLEYYQRNLAYPKLIALEGWRKTKSVSNKDRNTKENRRMAKALTAMSVVIPENGYILYADNNNDTPKGDHAHLFYDFYNFDVGRPVGGGKKLAYGVGLKEHKRGFVAYNISQRDFVAKRKNGTSVTIPSYSGLFCKEVGKTKCLPLD